MMTPELSDGGLSEKTYFILFYFILHDMTTNSERMDGYYP
jgi:hypothetical protein